MEEGVGVGSRFYCHVCMQVVNPIREVELKCPFCQSGFIEEMHPNPSRRRPDESDAAPDRALSLWAPILLGAMGNPLTRRAGRRLVNDHSIARGNENRESPREGESELDRELNSIRRSSAAFLQLLQGINAGISAESEGSESGRERERVQERERERVVLINPFSPGMVVQGPGNPSQVPNLGQSPFGAFGDYFIGHALDMLLQHLAENDPNRHGTLPAKKEAVEALKTVQVDDDLQCPVCLDEFEAAAEAKEMPCGHKFHGGCIVPWLELHSSCPVCRFELPADESKREPEMSRSNNNISLGIPQGNGDAREMQERGGTEPSIGLPWPLNALLSPSTPRGNAVLSQSATSTSSSDTTSQTDGDN